MWLVIQDPSDPHLRTIGVSDHVASETGSKGCHSWMLLPDDFGTPGYGSRRAIAIQEHFSADMQDRDELEWLFDYWLEPSGQLRNYLWAHRDEHVETAHRLIQILPPDAICHILKYLVNSYWQRYCGWPDLLIYRDDDFFFAEVKSSSDKLSEDQKNWIRDNYDI